MVLSRYKIITGLIRRQSVLTKSCDVRIIFDVLYYLSTFLWIIFANVNWLVISIGHIDAQNLKSNSESEHLYLNVHTR